MDKKVSVVIRTKNEEKYLGRVLEMLRKQTHKDLETIIVDDNSTDDTLNIAWRYGCEIVKLEPGKFTYPHACNVGVRNSSGEYVVFLSGHSIPMGVNWLRDGIANFEDKNVAGVYGVPYALPDANLLERVLYNFVSRFLRGKRRLISGVENVKMGVLGFTNAMIRRDLWERYPMNENFAAGGEDGDWARRWVSSGYVIVHDPRFKVYHSHNLGFLGLVRQFIGWIKMSGPRRFKAQERNFKQKS